MKKWSYLVLLIKFYSTRFKVSFQCSNISLKDITFDDAMLEMLSWKPITSASFDSVMKKFTKIAFKMKPYLLEMSSDPGLQNTKTELDEIEIRRIGRQISYLTSVWGNEFLDTSVTVYAGVIHDDYTFGAGKGLHRGSSSSASHQKKASPLNQPSRIPVQGK